MGLQTIPARKGKATKLSKGECVKVVNTHGMQVVDTWAYNAEDLEVCSQNLQLPKAAEDVAPNLPRRDSAALSHFCTGVLTEEVSRWVCVWYKVQTYGGLQASCNVHPLKSSTRVQYAAPCQVYLQPC